MSLQANKVLPVSQFNIRSVAVFGDRTTVAGGGSGNVVAPYIVTPFDGIFSYLNNRPAPTMTGNCTMEANVDYIQVRGLTSPPILHYGFVTPRIMSGRSYPRRRSPSMRRTAVMHAPSILVADRMDVQRGD